MPKLKASLVNTPREVGPGQRAALEAEYLRNLQGALGGEAGAHATYAHWLAHRGEKNLEVEDLRRVIQWESAHAKATSQALEKCPGDSALAFFLVHID
jgi:hypothetical protein